MVRPQVIQSFVARIWLERTGHEDPIWRGHIQHVQGLEDIYFQDLTEMSEFIGQVSGIPSLRFKANPDKVIAFSECSTIADRKRESGQLRKRSSEASRHHTTSSTDGVPNDR